MDSVNAYESKEILLKVKKLIRLFPNLLGHIKPEDIYMVRIEKLNEPAAEIRTIEPPYSYLTPHTYILLVYQTFFHLSNDLQHIALNKLLLGIPKNYHDFPVIRPFDECIYREENELLDWLRQHRFPLE